MEKVTLFEVDINTQDVTKSLIATQKEIEKLTAVQKDNKKTTDEERKAYIENEAQLKNLQREYRVQSKLLQDLNAIQVDNIQTVEEARRALSAVSTEWARVTKVEGENSVASQKLGSQKLLLTERLKKLEGATGDTRRNVGNYTASIIEAAKATGGFQGLAGGAQQVLGGIVQGFKAGQGGATGFIGGLKGIGGAITATGIGIFLQLLGLLIVALKKTETVTEPLEQAFAAVGAVIQELAIRGEMLLKSLGFLFEGDLKNAANEAAGAVDNIGKSFKNAASNAAKLKKDQQDLEDSASRLKLLNADAAKQVEILDAQSKNKTLDFKERLRLAKEANKIDKEIYELNLKQAIKEDLNAQKRLQSVTLLTNEELSYFLQKKNTGAKIDEINKKLDKERELNDKWIEKRNIRIDLERKSLTEQQKRQNRIDKLYEDEINNEEKAAAAAEKLSEDEKKRKAEIIKGLEEEVRLYEAKNQAILITEQNFSQELVAEEIKRLSELQALKVKVFEAQKKNGDITQAQFKLLLNGLDKEFQDFVNSVTNTSVTVALNKLKDDVKKAQLELSKGETAGLLTEESVNAQKALIEKLRLAKIKEAEALIKDKTDLEVALFEINKKAKQDTIALDREFKSQSDAREAINTANRIELLRLNGESELNLRREQLEMQRLQEIEAANKVKADITAINEKYRLLNQQLEEQAVIDRLQLAGKYLSQFSKLVGENTAFGKLAASAAAAINTAQAITVALKSEAPFPQRVAEVAFAAATGLSAIIKINSTKVPTAPSSSNKFEKGGLAGGKRHAQGGTKYYGEDGRVVELEKGEAWYVLNRNATAQLENLEALNSLFPAGKKLGTFQSGGFAQQKSQMNASALIASADIASTISNTPIVVDVKDIISEVDRRVEVVDSATF